MLDIETYNSNEDAARAIAPARAIEAFGPVTFDNTHYPVRVSREIELLRYVDTMHDAKGAKYFGDGSLFSQREAEIVGQICETVAEFTSRHFGRRTRPWVAPLAAVPLWRVVSAWAEALKLSSPSVLEFGPGSGYLGAALIKMGFRYASMDISQGFYLWQNRLYEALAPSDFYEMAADREPVRNRSAAVTHIPWWHFVKFGADLPIHADFVVCDHALGEMSKVALRFVLRESRRILSGPGPKLFLFTSPGANFVQNLDQIFAEFAQSGYCVLATRSYAAFAPIGSELSPYALRLERGLMGKIRRRLGNNRQKPLPHDLAALENGVPAVGGGKPGIPGREFIPLRADEAPLDYDFLARAEIGAPLTVSR